MPETEEAGAPNLTGVWHGRYAYPQLDLAVPFVATLSEISAWLDGVTEEQELFAASAGIVLRATLHGRRGGRVVTWRKTYDAPSKLYDVVEYAGKVSVDGTEIAGRWTVPGHWSGTFLMIRSLGKAASATRRRTTKA